MSIDKSVTIIGAGFAGLAAAAYMAKAGFEVHVLEQHNQAGGRARLFKENGFTFDMGPSWYWMPDVFESFFADFGYQVSDFYQLKRLDPGYRVFFEQNNWVDIPADYQALKQLFEEKEKGAAAKLDSFLKQAQYKYQVGMGKFVHKPSLSIWEFASLSLLKDLISLDVFNSVSSHTAKFFTHEHLRKIIEFPVLFLGAMPHKIPSMYTLMNHADLRLGTWYPQGGMYKIVEAMVQVAKSLGVQFHFNTKVNTLDSNQKQITAINTNQGIFKSKYVISGSDYHHTETDLLKPLDRSYNTKFWNKQVMAPSSLLFYIGLNKKLKNLQHHNLFFDEDFAQHASDIYQSPVWPKKPLFYASVPSLTDDTVAPQGCENLFLLIPIAPGLQENHALIEQYYQILMQRLEKHTGQSIADAVVFKRAYGPSNFIADYHAFKGNAYGLANTLLQTAFLKPKMKSKRLNNLFFTGQLTVPGPGVPPSLISGKIVSNLIIQNHA